MILQKHLNTCIFNISQSLLPTEFCFLCSKHRKKKALNGNVTYKNSHMYNSTLKPNQSHHHLKIAVFYQSVGRKGSGLGDQLRAICEHGRTYNIICSSADTSFLHLSDTQLHTATQE